MAAGEEYIALMSFNKADRDARQAFHEAVVQILGSSGRIFDFGAGAGVDAQFYARHGYSVLAYDNDPRMCDAFTNRCGAEIKAGQIRLYRGDYGVFLRELAVPDEQLRKVDLITSNFAPLNLVPDLSELFRAFRGISAPHGRILASVLNPWFLGDMQYRWWWSNRCRYGKSGEFGVAGTSGDIWRRSRARFAAQAEPYFRLRAVLRGLPCQGAALQPCAGLALSTSRFMFLLFEST